MEREDRRQEAALSVSPFAGCGDIYFRVQMSRCFAWTRAVEKHEIYIKRVIKL